jgi:CheY-like chemotaxis protein
VNPSTPNAPPERRRVLIVDDDPTMVHVLARTLMDCAQLYFSVRGEDALKKLHAHRPDLMLIDVDMPDLSGYEVVKRMLDHPDTRGTQVIMVTSHTEDSYRRQALELGVVDFFLKPINRQDILDRVDQLLSEEMESIELSFSPHGDFTSKTEAARPRTSDVWQGHETEFAPTQIFGDFADAPPPPPKTPPAPPTVQRAPQPVPVAAAPLTEPAADASADDITSELFERMSAILEQTESIRHTEQNSLSPAVSQRISRIEEECAEVIQLLVTLSDRENAPV